MEKKTEKNVFPNLWVRDDTSGTGAYIGLPEPWSDPKNTVLYVPAERVRKLLDDLSDEEFPVFGGPHDQGAVRYARLVDDAIEKLISPEHGET